MAAHSSISITLICICPSIFRSSFPLRVSSTALRTVLISAQRTTARLSSRRQGPAVPAHAGPNTVAVTAAAAARAAAAQAAPIRPKWRLQMILTSAPLQQWRATPQVIQQRAAVVQGLLLRRRKKGSKCATGSDVSFVLYFRNSVFLFCSGNIQFLMPFFSGITVWFIQKEYLAFSCCAHLIYFLHFFKLLLFSDSSNFVSSQVWPL